jgi:hypothetical protein
MDTGKAAQITAVLSTFRLVLLMKSIVVEAANDL